jgi:endonuclease-3 related protein
MPAQQHLKHAAPPVDRSSPSRGRGLPRSRPFRRRLFRLYDALLRRFGPQGWWPARSALEAVVGAILTHRTTRVNEEGVVPTRRRAGGPHRRRPRPLAAPARASGSGRVETGRLRAFRGHLARRHGGRLRQFLRQPAPALRAELLTMPGVGPRTADAILLYAAGRPIFVVDGHARRILARHRVVAADVGDRALQALLMDHLPRDPALFNEYRALLGRVAKEYCRASVARCAECPLRFDLGGRPPRR